MDGTRLQNFLAFAFDTYIRLSAISFPPRSRIHISHPRFLSIYLSYLSIIAFCSGNNRKHPCLLFGSLPSRPALLLSLSDSSIQLPRKYNIISYTHSITITYIHHSSLSLFITFFCTRPAGFRIQKFCVYTYIHYITHRRAVDSLLIPFPLSFSFLFLFFHIRSSFFSI